MASRNQNWRGRVQKHLMRANIAIPDLPMEDDKIEVIRAISKVMQLLAEQEMRILKEAMENG